jgi:hypothetical protein
MQAGRPDFLYVADCKLCSRTTLAHIDKHNGMTRYRDREVRKVGQVARIPGKP